ncbi:molybdopterin-dependent oxidoreductase [Actinophytocola gossypii]|uniref:Molybdopterin-dependent oxidoreductase n=1 Tax=Actinophytocola gossypii TaxID=2812003 RepID=A0ABT2JCS3_9PSEU|nr:molybdopterin-dependent oxidoreductase [Actinophytocola gossypii]MCT2585667.1 molybdopterin-dependent oxidoreductase [Actinophytocola gossypii]
MSRGRAIAVALVSLGAALAAGHLVAGFVGPPASPFLAVGNWVRDLSPHPVTEWAKDTFGTADKLVLFLGVTLVILGCAVAAGLLSRTRPWPGLLVAGALGVVGFVAVLTRPDLGQLGILAPAASLLAGVGTFNLLHKRADPVTSTGRRDFLRLSAGVAVGAGVLGGVGQAFGSRVDVEASRRAVGRLRVAEPAPPIPAGADFPGTVSFLTDNRDFYRIDTALTVPRVTADGWSLRVHGLVDRELELDFAAIRERPLVERTITMACVSNEVGGSLVSTANFIGVPLRDVLLEAGVRPEADQLLSTSVDGFTAGSPVDAVLDPERGALLAIGMNGEPLPVEHGFPARLVVPGLYGYVSATKWLTELELTTFAAEQGYWIPRGWSALGPVKTQSRIDTPRDGDTTGTTVTVAGVAWAPAVGIDRVEVAVDVDSGGDWRDARLAAEVGRNTWRMWRATVDLPPGEHRIAVRATDRNGETQTDAFAPPAPNGASGWHTITVTSR